MRIDGETVPAFKFVGGRTGIAGRADQIRDYTLCQAMEGDQQVTETRTTLGRTTTKHWIGRDRAKEYVVRIVPPPGWQATPEEYRVTKSTKNLDFTLRRVASP